MSFKLSDIANNAVNSKHVVRIFGNPLIVAMIIVIIVFLVMYFVMRDQIEIVDESTRSLIYFIFTTGVYTFIGCVCVLFLHHKVVQTSLEKKYGVGEEEDVVNEAINRRQLFGNRASSTASTTSV